MAPTLNLVRILLGLLLTVSLLGASALPQWNDANTDAGKVGVPAEGFCYRGGAPADINDTKKATKAVCGPASKTTFGPGGQPEIRALQQNSLNILAGPIIAKVVWHDNPACVEQGKTRLKKKQCTSVFNQILNTKSTPGGCDASLGGFSEDLCFLYVLESNPKSYDNYKSNPKGPATRKRELTESETNDTALALPQLHDPIALAATSRSIKAPLCYADGFTPSVIHAQIAINEVCNRAEGLNSKILVASYMYDYAPIPALPNDLPHRILTQRSRHPLPCAKRVVVPHHSTEDLAEVEEVVAWSVVVHV